MQDAIDRHAPDRFQATRAEIFEQIVLGRHSVRGFTGQPIPDALLKHLFSVSRWAPSNCNVQPWFAHVASGAAAERIRAGLYALADADVEPKPDVHMHVAYPGEWRERQIYDVTDVARDDRAARRASVLRNYRFFDAPHVAFLFTPDWGDLTEAANVGMYAQTLMLAMAAHGIGSCAQGALGQYADFVHAELGVPQTLRLLFGIAFGYPDTSHPANAARTDRAPDGGAVFHD
jgi:nitroreductase